MKDATLGRRCNLCALFAQAREIVELAVGCRLDGDFNTGNSAGRQAIDAGSGGVFDKVFKGNIIVGWVNMGWSNILEGSGVEVRMGGCQ